MSGYCNKRESVCVGLTKDSACNLDSDCGQGFYCRTAINWPFQTTCSQLRSEFELCERDYECQNHQFCWYPNKEHSEKDRKTCMPLYSQESGTTFGWKADDL